MTKVTDYHHMVDNRPESSESTKYWNGQEKKFIFQSDEGKSFNQEQAIDLLVSLVATDANSEKKWRGFYNSLSSPELQESVMTTGKLERIERNKKTCSKAGSLGDLEQVFPCFHCSEDLNSSRWVFLPMNRYLAT